MWLLHNDPLFINYITSPRNWSIYIVHGQLVTNEQHSRFAKWLHSTNHKSIGRRHRFWLNNAYIILYLLHLTVHFNMLVLFWNTWFPHNIDRRSVMIVEPHMSPGKKTHFDLNIMCPYKVTCKISFFLVSNSTLDVETIIPRYKIQQRYTTL